MWCMKFCFLVPSPTPKPNPKKDRQSNETGIWSDPDIFVRKNSTVWRKSCFGCLRWSLNPPKHAHAHRKSTWQTWCCQHIGPCIQECSCVSSDKYFSAARSFGDCAAFCAAQKFPRFHYETTADATGTCACCTFGGMPGTEASTGSVYTYADNATVREYVIEPICTQCSCQSTGGWRGYQSLESCARTCEQEGSWFKHASGRRYDGLPGPWVYFSAYDHVPKIVERNFVPVVDNVDN